MSEAVDILIAGSTRVIRTVVRQELGRFSLTLGECSNLEDLLAGAKRNVPRAILVQGDVLGEQAGAALARLRSLAPREQSLILVFSSSPELGGPCLEAGADGFLEFPFAYDQLKAYTSLILKRQRCVLLVDDTKTIHAAIQEALREEPYEILHAYDGRQGIAILEKQDVDLIITDVEMPEMNGYEFCHWVKSHPRYKTIPVYMSSTLSASADIDRGFDAGADEYLVKPVDPDDLRERLRQFLGSQLRHQRDSILIVDRMDQVAQLIANALETQGFRVTVLKTVDQAMASVDVLKPALLILGEENASAEGRELIRSFKSRKDLARMPCLMVTERETQLEKRKARQAGVDAFVSKPFTSDKVLVLVERLIAESKVSRERDALKTENHLIQDQLILLNATLAQKVEEKTRAIRALLDNTSIGILLIGRDFRILPDYSAHLEDILEDKDLVGKDLDEVLFRRLRVGDYERSRSRMVVEWSITDDVMLFEANNPACIREGWGEFGGREKFLEFDWSPILAKDGRTVEKILISVRDGTEAMRLRMAADEASLKVTQLLEVLGIGVSAYLEFEKRARFSLESLLALTPDSKDPKPASPESLRRIYIGLHTLKGEARFLKLNSLTEALHQAEAVVNPEREGEGVKLDTLQARLEAIGQVLGQYQTAIQPLLEGREASTPSQQQLEEDLSCLYLSFAGMADQLAKDLGKAGCDLKAELPQPYALAVERSRVMHECLVHLIRNSIDHGLEKAEERRAVGKPERGRIVLRLNGPGELVFEDNGRGLNLERLAQKAKELGKKWTNEAELAELIFDPGFSTKEQVDQISGRGVGMDAVRLRLQDVGGDIRIEALERKGSFLLFRFVIKWNS